MPNNPLGPAPGGNQTALDVSATTVIKATPGRIYTVNVTTAGSTTGSIYDNNSAVSGNVAAALVAVVPLAIGIYPLGPFPCVNTGIVFVPGTGMVASIAFE